MKRATSRCQAFSLVELLVVVGIITVLTVLLMPTLSRARERANRVACANNLRTIGQGIQIYAKDNQGQYPRTLSCGVCAMTAFGMADATDPFHTPLPSHWDVSAALFLLVRNAGLPTSVFVCPSTNDVPDDLGKLTAANRSNFSRKANLSYSIACPYPFGAALTNGYHWGGRLAPDFALAADISPGTGPSSVANIYEETDPNKATKLQTRKMNSANHSREGQNVLYVDGHVSFENSPFVGVDGDNIYTAADVSFGNPMETPPSKATDSLLVPTDD